MSKVTKDGGLTAENSLERTETPGRDTSVHRPADTRHAFIHVFLGAYLVAELRPHPGVGGFECPTAALRDAVVLWSFRWNRIEQGTVAFRTAIKLPHEVGSLIHNQSAGWSDKSKPGLGISKTNVPSSRPPITLCSILKRDIQQPTFKTQARRPLIPSI